MNLSLEHKSLYLILFNATMIGRSPGKTLMEDELKQFKIAAFEEVDKLAGRMDKGEISEDDIMSSIDSLRARFRISFGQAQKPINVILKYHFYLTRSWDTKTKGVLHCPIDSVQLERLGKRGTSLARLDKDNYLELQAQIQTKGQTRIDFDRMWDELNLRSSGILCEPYK